MDTPAKWPVRQINPSTPVLQIVSIHVHGFVSLHMNSDAYLFIQ